MTAPGNALRKTRCGTANSGRFFFTTSLIPGVNIWWLIDLKNRKEKLPDMKKGRSWWSDGNQGSFAFFAPFPPVEGQVRKNLRVLASWRLIL
jgi:hypothetical protein